MSASRKAASHANNGNSLRSLSFSIFHYVYGVWCEAEPGGVSNFEAEYVWYFCEDDASGKGICVSGKNRSHGILPR